MADIGAFDPAVKKTAVETASRAFFDDPLYIFIEPDNEKRMRVLTAQMKMAVSLFQRAGLIDSTPDGKAVVMWMKPGHTDPSPLQML